MFRLDDDEDDEREEKSQHSPLEKKLEEAMLKMRRVFLSTDVNDKSSAEVIKKLWLLEALDPGKPITLFICSPGGSIDAGFAIWDQVKMISSPVTTVVTGLAASMGSLLSLVAEKGRRFATPNSRIMIHQPRISGVMRGQATDLEIQAEEIIKTRAALVKIYVDATGKDVKDIEKALDRDKWLSAEEAKEFGLLDRIVTSFDDL
ncbi:MAG: ATP-dependent Clp protease proteolytic subunit [Simkaniaceae bacterium]|nr:ATP-dependent Clp protease proteolytic subunit [Simkaniaceae bacterium]